MRRQRAEGDEHKNQVSTTAYKICTLGALRASHTNASNLPMKHFLFLIGLFITTSALAGETNLKLPRFVSFKSSEVNMRSGPGTDYPITWVYKRKHLPVEIVEEYENWRKIKDFQGNTGWVFKAMIQGERSAMIKKGLEPLYKRPDDSSQVVLRAEKGVIGKLEGCREEWCQVEMQDISGWIKREKIYGAYKDEDF